MQINTQDIRDIFKDPPTIKWVDHFKTTFDKGYIVRLKGKFVHISTQEEAQYIISNQHFVKIINATVLKGGGYFEGPWDENGQKLAHLFFAHLPSNTTIYLNDMPKKLTHALDGKIDFK
jgi:hypothetical protein